MRVFACTEDCIGIALRAVRRGAALVTFGILTFASAMAFDGSNPSGSEKIPLKNFGTAQQALRVGLDDLRAGDLESSLAALTYAAEGGQAVARWKLGEMYADGVGVARDDLKAYHYFNQVVEDYDEDQPDRRNLSLVSNAFVAIGVYCLKGIPNSEVRSDPERAHELFQYAATTFGDPNAEYNLANMYIVGAGVVPKDKVTAVRWLALAAAKGHRFSQALLGHMLFSGDGVAHQRAKGLMWLEIAKDGSQDSKDEWIRELHQRDFAAASDEDRQMAAALLDERAKSSMHQAKNLVRSTSVLRPVDAPSLPGSPPPPAAQ
jgi:hypothetical protein